MKGGGTRTVNWFGEPSPTEETVNVSYDTEPEVQERILRRDEVADEIVGEADEPLCVSVTWPDSLESGWTVISMLFTMQVDDMEQFMRLMEDAPYLPVPQWIPDGYEFAHGKILYAYHPNGQKTHASTFETEDGLTVDVYRATGDGHIFPYRYALVYQRGEDVLGVAATLSGGRDPATETFTVAEGRDARAIDSPDFENVLFVSHDDCSILWTWNDLTDEIPYCEQAGGEIQAYRDVIGMVQQSIGRSEPDAATLLRIFTGE